MQHPSEIMRELHDVLHMALQESTGDVEIDAVPGITPITPIPWPWLFNASGLYEWKFSLPILPPAPQPGPDSANRQWQF